MKKKEFEHVDSTNISQFYEALGKLSDEVATEYFNHLCSFGHPFYLGE